MEMEIAVFPWHIVSSEICCGPFERLFLSHVTADYVDLKHHEHMVT